MNGSTPLASSGAGGKAGGVQALFPDGTSAITVEAADGSSTPLTMINNLVSQNIAGTPQALRWTSPDGGRHSLSLGAPADKGE